MGATGRLHLLRLTTSRKNTQGPKGEISDTLSMSGTGHAHAHILVVVIVIVIVVAVWRGGARRSRSE